MATKTRSTRSTRSTAAPKATAKKSPAKATRASKATPPTPTRGPAKETMEFAARVVRLRDRDGLAWKDVAAKLGVRYDHNGSSRLRRAYTLGEGKTVGVRATATAAKATAKKATRSTAKATPKAAKRTVGSAGRKARQAKAARVAARA